MINHLFRNLQELAHDLQQACEWETGLELTARPWNQIDLYEFHVRIQRTEFFHGAVVLQHTWKRVIGLLLA